MKNSIGDEIIILIVEDEINISEFCRRDLIAEGFKVDTAENGKVAQAMIEKKSYNLCLVDIRTPEMNGIELFQWLEEKYPQQANRVIFTTGGILGTDIKTFIQQTGRTFLPKPFDREELQEIVRETLEHMKK